jgi:biotin operon repressor
VLFGLEIAYTLQAMKGRVFEHREGRGALTSADPQWLIPLMVVLARRGLDGRPVSRQDLAEDLELRLDAVNELLGRLEAEGLVLRVSRDGDDVGLTLATGPERIPLTRLLEIAARSTIGMPPRGGPEWEALQALLAQQRQGAGERTLAEML